MLHTDFTEFFKYITSTIVNYVMAVALILLIYLLAVTFVRIVFGEICKVIFTARIPIVSPSANKTDTEA